MSGLCLGCGHHLGYQSLSRRPHHLVVFWVLHPKRELLRLGLQPAPSLWTTVNAPSGLEGIRGLFSLSL